MAIFYFCFMAIILASFTSVICKLFLEPKAFVRRHPVIYFAGLYICLCLFSVSRSIPSHLYVLTGFFGTYIIILLTILFCYRNSPGKKIFVFFIITLLLSVCDLIALTVYQLIRILATGTYSSLFNMDYVASGKDQILFSAGNMDGLFNVLLMPSIYIVVSILLCRFLLPAMQKVFRTLHIPTFITLMAAVLIPNGLRLPLSALQDTSFFPALALVYWSFCFISYILLWHFLKNISMAEKQRLQKEAKRLLIQKQLVCFKEQAEEYQKLRKWNHDIENHLQALSWLMATEQYEKAEEYSSSLLQAEKNRTQS